MNRIAVLLATHNGELWLNKQIQSLLQQEGVTIDVFASDDASSDNTLEVLRDYSNKFVNFHIVEYPAPAGSAARNFTRLLNSINLGQYKYISFCDQDDLWNSDKLDRALKALESQNCDGYSAPVEIFSNGKVLGILNQSPNSRKFDFLFEGAGQGCTFVITTRLARAYIDAINKSPEWIKGPFYHDWCIYALSRLLEYRWYFDTKPVLLYRQHGSNDVGAKSTINGITSRISRIKSGWYSDRVKHVYMFSRQVLNSDSDLEDFFCKAVLSKSTFAGRLVFLKLLAFKSRRKFSDRLVVTVSELFGYISRSF